MTKRRKHHSHIFLKYTINLQSKNFVDILKIFLTQILNFVFAETKRKKKKKKKNNATFIN